MKLSKSIWYKIFDYVDENELNIVKCGDKHEIKIIDGKTYYKTYGEEELKYLEKEEKVYESGGLEESKINICDYSIGFIVKNDKKDMFNIKLATIINMIKNEGKTGYYIGNADKYYRKGIKNAVININEIMECIEKVYRGESFKLILPYIRFYIEFDYNGETMGMGMKMKDYTTDYTLGFDNYVYELCGFSNLGFHIRNPLIFLYKLYFRMYFINVIEMV